MEKPRIYRIPSGLVGVQFAKDDPAALRERYFQKSIMPHPEKCPFEPGKGAELIVANLASMGRSGWVIREHPQPASAPHYIVRPGTCVGWTEEDVRTLGGAEEIYLALVLLSKCCTDMAGREVKILVHAEAARTKAQSGHIGWHIFPEPVELDMQRLEATKAWMKHSELTVLEKNEITGAVGGWLDGQINFYETMGLSLRALARKLSAWLSQLIELFGKKFTSSQGLRPDFSITLRVTPNGQLRYGMFFPKLKHVGAYEYAGLTEGTSFSLACSWEAMHAYLTEA